MCLAEVGDCTVIHLVDMFMPYPCWPAVVFVESSQVEMFLA